MELEPLLGGLAAGDDGAGSQLLELLRPFVVGRLNSARKARNWYWLTDVEDAAQEVLLRFVEAVRAGTFVFRDEPQLKGFLVRTAFFVAMHEQDEHLVAWPDDEVAEGAERFGADALRRFNFSEFADAAFDSLGRRQCLEELYSAVEALPTARAEVLRLTLLGLAPRQIAPLMERSVNAVSVLKTHALDDLRTQLANTEFEQNCGRYFLEA